MTEGRRKVEGGEKMRRRNETRVGNRRGNRKGVRKDERAKEKKINEEGEKNRGK